MDVSHSACLHIDELTFSKKQNNFFVKRQAFARFPSWLLPGLRKCWSKLFSNTWWCMSVGLPLNFSWADVIICWFNGRCWAIIFIILRYYCQDLWQILLPIFGADVIALIFEVVISNLLADIGPMLFNIILANVIAMIYGSSCWQFCLGLTLLPLYFGRSYCQIC